MLEPSEFSLIYFIVFTMLWIYFVDITIHKKDYIALKYLQFIFSIPLIISIANNSYVNGFAFGYVFCFVIGIVSIYIMIADYIT